MGRFAMQTRQRKKNGIHEFTVEALFALDEYIIEKDST